MFDKLNAYPCFPNVPPPPVILEYKLKSGSHVGDDENEGGQEIEVGDGDEEYEEEE
jgi:hypothetical protein